MFSFVYSSDLTPNLCGGAVTVKASVRDTLRERVPGSARGHQLCSRELLSLPGPALNGKQRERRWQRGTRQLNVAPRPGSLLPLVAGSSLSVESATSEF